jgi:hypothetical protein
LKSPDPLAAPAMLANYLSTPRDRATLVAGIRLARKLAATRALAPYVESEYRPGPDATSDDALLEFARNTAGTIFHPSGTCKMGPAADPLAVVDADFGSTASPGSASSIAASCPPSSPATRMPGGDDRGEDRRPNARRWHAVTPSCDNRRA